MKIVKGDLIKAAIDGDISVIAHCCNCFGKMKSGIAPQIARAFPSAEEVDSKTTSGDSAKLGNCTVAFDETTCTTIYNLYGQYGYWKKTDGSINLNYYHLAKSLEKMRDDMLDYGLESDKIGFPKIGCGLAGGDWSVVGQMIETIFEKFDVTIYEL